MKLHSLRTSMKPSGASASRRFAWPGWKFWKWRVQSDRGAIILCLTAPFIVTAISFCITVGWVAFLSATHGDMSSRPLPTVIAYLVVTFSVMVLPAYTAGCGWWIWATRDENANLVKQLWFLPLISTLFVWFPTLTMAEVEMTYRLQMFPVLIAISLLSGYIWIGLVRLAFYFWRQKR